MLVVWWLVWTVQGQPDIPSTGHYLSFLILAFIVDLYALTGD